VKSNRPPKSKITFLGKLLLEEDGMMRVPFHTAGGVVCGTVLPPMATEAQRTLPFKIGDGYSSSLWVFKLLVFSVEGYRELDDDEIRLLLKHEVYKRERAFDRIRKEVAAFENLEDAIGARRERIPAPVRLFVWQRDEGKCVNCGRKERLEYDHIIPVAEGGSSTERNLQLLCESCNRGKGKRI
jgi:hypothetical protein